MRLWSFDRWTAATPLRSHARAAVRNGFAVVFLRPGGKEPLCPLTARERKKAGPQHPCGVAHASKDEGWVLRKAKQLTDAYGQVNLGIAAHASGVVVIDADTPEQVESVTSFLRELGDTAAILADQPTVKTPGSQRNGVWVHEQGTHWYFNRPAELNLPEHPGHMTLTGGAVMRWGNSYTLVPPSVRAEGYYVSLAEYIDDVPVGLAAIILNHVHDRQDVAVELMSRFHDDRIVEWSIRTPWHRLLEEDGWFFTGKLDRQCGCPVWRRPGDDASTDRSAIAHEDDCTRLPNYEGHGALYVFSDNPPGLLGERVAAGQRTFTKLQYVALMHYDGDEQAAKVALGIELDPADWLNKLSGDATEPEAAAPAEDPPEGRRSLIEAVNETVSEVLEEHGFTLMMLDELAGMTVKETKQLIVRESVQRLLTPEPPTNNVVGVTLADVDDDLPLADTVFRSDGVPTIASKRMSTAWGPSDSGKSWFAAYSTIDTVHRDGEVLIIDTEDSAGGWKYRFGHFDVDLAKIHYVREYHRLTRREQLQVMVTAERCKLIALDSIDGYLSVLGVDSNHATQVRAAMNPYEVMAAVSGAAILTIDHSGEKLRPGERATTASGTGAKKAGVSGTMMRVDKETLWLPGQVCSSMVMIGKERHGTINASAEWNPAGGVQQAFGRLARLRIIPPLHANSERYSTLELLKPPSYADEPTLAQSTKDADRQAEVIGLGTAVFEFLDAAATTDDGWRGVTAIAMAVGRTNDKTGIVTEVLEGLLKDHLLEHREKRQGRVHEYRLAPGE